MEEIYLVHAEAVAVKTALNANDIDNVDAIIFVSARAQDEAQTLASSALTAHGYHLISVFSVSVPILSAVLRSDIQLITHYHAAIELGYSIEIMAHPRGERHLGYSFESRTLIPRIPYKTENH
jgi:hypothetical protein